MNTKPVYFLMGPTGAGKTALVTKLALDHPRISVISVDSAMIYRTMDIGTAKPTLAEQAKVPHQLIDLLDPKDTYSVAQFCQDATKAIDQAHQQGKMPFLVGGTMLYFNALKKGLSPLPPRDDAVRDRLQKDLEAKGLTAMYHALCQRDPSATRLHAHDSQRILRALEVIEITGKPMASFWDKPIDAAPWPIHAFALMPEDRTLLHQNIATRFVNMLDHGFLDEAKALYDRGDLHPTLPSMRAVNYRQAWQYFEGKLSLAEMQTNAIVATRQLAKRQITWLRGFTDVCTMPHDASLYPLICQSLR